MGGCVFGGIKYDACHKQKNCRDVTNQHKLNIPLFCSNDWDYEENMTVACITRGTMFYVVGLFPVISIPCLFGYAGYKHMISSE